MPAVPAPAAPPRFLRPASPEQLEHLYQQARGRVDNVNAIPYFDRLAAGRYRDLIRRPSFDPSKPSIVTSFQPKSGGTFLHNRLLELGYHEFWWCFPHVQCHSYWYTSQQTLELYLRGGVACQTHCRPDAALLEAFDRCGVEQIWVHLRNPVESAISAYHHYRGEGHGDSVAADERRRQARRATQLFRFLRRSDKDQFVREQIDWFIEWTGQWLRFDAEQPGRVVISFHRELADPQQMLNRVFRQFGVESPGRITPSPAANDRFRPNPLRNWRHDVDGATQRFVEKRIRESLAAFPAFERLWS
ncbi:hypothetical protein [Lacipirellula limnantheis]|uniref:Sulfotransferase domain protein n=1 Tax=Lacipirellula limnantheis TaxID=2528024 RepID=A0A517TXI1_9BACT|nr:hypothetical protein [Lacipirellula limnantheis]QDT73071.1 hypothetical protein I41_22600 [Lacipirellula limnantheis]